MEDLSHHGLVPVAEVASALARAAMALPVRCPDGVRFAVVDPDDYPALAVHRWYDNGHGYAVRNLRRGRMVSLHRELLGLKRGDGYEGDHINGNRLDNRRANLRIVTKAQNMQNRARGGYGVSRHRGVTWDKQKGRWKAQAKLNGRYRYIGHFDNEQDAADAAAAWRELHMPFTTN